MTARDRVWSGLVAALLAGGLWVGLRLEARTQAAIEASRELARKERALLTAGQEEMASYRQARTELLGLLSEGEVERARLRLRELADVEEYSALREDDSRALSVASLWPDRSQARSRATAALRQLLEKHAAGFDTEPAQQALARVAAAARGGRRDEALAAFAEVEELLRSATLRPGFSAPPSAQPPVVPTDRRRLMNEVARMTEDLRRVRDQVIPGILRETRLGEAEQSFMRRLQGFCDELLTAARRGRDIRPLRAILDQLGSSALQDRDLPRAERHLESARAMLASVPMLPPGEMGSAAGPDGARPAPLRDPEVRIRRILEWMDTLRKAPEAEFQSQRDTFARSLARLLGARRPTGGAPGPAAPASAGLELVGEGPSLLVGARGEIQAIRLSGRVGSSDSLGGWWLRLDTSGGSSAEAQRSAREIPIPMKATGPGRHALDSPAGRLESTVRSGKGNLEFALKVARSPAPLAGELILRLPLALGGWSLDGAEKPMSVEDRPAIWSPEGDLRFRNGVGELALSFPGAEEVRVLPRAGRVEASYPIPVAGATRTINAVVRYTPDPRP